MAVRERSPEFSCDNCGDVLPTSSNDVVIQTDKECVVGWKRLRVVIRRFEGVDNHAQDSPADLCQKCATELLADAVKRVTSNERITAGVRTIGALKFDQTF